MTGIELHLVTIRSQLLTLSPSCAVPNLGTLPLLCSTGQHCIVLMDQKYF